MSQSSNAAHHHGVQFFGSDASLFKTAAGFLAEGLIAGQPAIIIATEVHRQGLVDALGARLVDVTKASRNGDLLLLDAETTLNRFMVDGWPDPNAFEHHVGQLFQQLLKDRQGSILRAYGEMVDVLWQLGRTEAAIQLEILWNKLSTRFGFALLCGYAMGSFFKHAERMQEVCEQHTHVVDSETAVPFKLDRTVTH